MSRPTAAIMTLSLLAAACSDAAPSKDAPGAPASTAETNPAVPPEPATVEKKADESRSAPQIIRTTDQTLCGEFEDILYSCQIGGRTLSVCASSIQPADISYSYGRSVSEVEMHINASDDNGRVHQGGVVGQGGGQLTHLRFTNGDTQYIVYSGYTGRLAATDGKWSGVAIQRNGRSVADMQCPYTGPYTELSQSSIPDFVPQEPNDTYNAWY